MDWLNKLFGKEVRGIDQVGVEIEEIGEEKAIPRPAEEDDEEVTK